jgi:hypothetical protein
MKHFPNPQKQDVAAPWSAVTPVGDKRQRRVMRFFEPHFVARDIGPLDVDDATLRAIVAALPVNAAKTFFKQPDANNRYAANSFVRALADIERRAHFGLPQLTEIRPLNAEARADKAAFEARFAAQLESLFINYRLPNAHANAEMRAKLAAKGRAVITESNKYQVTNGLFNAFAIVATAIGAPDRLVELCSAKARPIITQAVKADTSGRAIEMARSLSELAQAHEDYAAAGAFNQLAVGVSAQNDGGVISAELLLDLQPFAAQSVFHRFGAALVAQAKFAQPGDLKKKATLCRVGGALGALAAVSAPATFDIIVDCSFVGQVDWRRARPRPTLFSFRHGSLEAQLNSRARDLVDDFFFGFCDAFGFPPLSLLAGEDGQLRRWAQASVNKLLVRIDAPFTGQALRDLGVYRMAWRGDSNETMATAARLNLRYFKAYFKPMLDDIAERKGTRHDKP